MNENLTGWWKLREKEETTSLVVATYNTYQFVIRLACLSRVSTLGGIL